MRLRKQNIKRKVSVKSLLNQAPVSIWLKDEATFVKDEDGEGDDDEEEEERGKHD